MLFIVLLPVIVYLKELIMRTMTIKAELKNIKNESILFKFLKLIFLSKGLYTAIESGNVFHIINKAPTEAIPIAIKMLTKPFFFILFILML